MPPSLFGKPDLPDLLGSEHQNFAPTQGLTTTARMCYNVIKRLSFRSNLNTGLGRKEEGKENAA